MTDAPAWGLDELAAWVVSRIEDSCAGKALLIGHSTGGAIALRLAGLRPDVLRGLMLINSGPKMNNHGDVRRLINDLEHNRVSTAVHSVLKRSFYIQPPPQDFQSLLNYGLAAPSQAAIEVLRSQRRTNLLASLRCMQVPVAVVHGRHDSVRSVSEARLMAASVPNGSLVLAECGHSPMYEMPEIVSSALQGLDRRSHT